MKTLVLALAVSALTGCGTFLPIQSVETTGLKTAESAAMVKVLTDSGGMQSAGDLVGYSCMNKIWSPPATAEAATYQVKLAAAQVNATAITKLSCHEGAVSLISNCWQSYTCKATALK
jgi:hypothetical protein